MASYNYLKFRSRTAVEKVNILSLKKEAKNLVKSEKKNTLLIIFIAILVFTFSGFIISL